jgi:hypothetical protein
MFISFKKTFDYKSTKKIFLKMWRSLKIILTILQIIYVICFNDEIKIFKNEMTLEMEQHVIAEALLITKHESDLNTIAKKLSNEMNKEFGGKWSCFTGINTTFAGFNIESEKNTFIWFSFREKHFVVFKQAFDSVIDPIVSARKTNANITIIDDRMTESMKKSVLEIIKTSIFYFNTTESIAENVVKNLKSKFGNSWHCVIGEFRIDKELMQKAMNSSILSLRVGSLLIAIFQLREESSVCEKQVILSAFK